MLVAPRWSPRGHDVRSLLARNGVPHVFHDSDSDTGQRLLEEAGHPGAEVPVVFLLDREVLVDPSNAELARAYGVSTELEAAARLRRRRRGRRTCRPGGFGVRVLRGAADARDRARVDRRPGRRQLTDQKLPRLLAWGERRGAGPARVPAGVDFRDQFRAHAGRDRAPDRRRPPLRSTWTMAARRREGGDPRHGRRIPAARYPRARRAERGRASSTGRPSRRRRRSRARTRTSSVGETRPVRQPCTCAATRVSARRGPRGSSLADSMSQYLRDQLEKTDNVDIRCGTEVTGGGGEGRLDEHRRSGTGDRQDADVPAAALFVLIGARPNTDWLPDDIERDPGGYVKTGSDASQGPLAPDRPPQPLETCVPGVFAVGDLRHSAVKRVASAVGEGSVVVRQVLEHLERDAEVFVLRGWRATDPTRPPSDARPRAAGVGCRGDGGAARNRRPHPLAGASLGAAAARAAYIRPEHINPAGLLAGPSPTRWSTTRWARRCGRSAGGRGRGHDQDLDQLRADGSRGRGRLRDAARPPKRPRRGARSEVRHADGRLLATAIGSFAIFPGRDSAARSGGPPTRRRIEAHAAQGGEREPSDQIRGKPVRPGPLCLELGRQGEQRGLVVRPPHELHGQRQPLGREPSRNGRRRVSDVVPRRPEARPASHSHQRPLPAVRAPLLHGHRRLADHRQQHPRRARRRCR